MHHCHLVVTTRPGFDWPTNPALAALAGCRVENAAELSEAVAGKILLQCVTLLEISASAIRQQIQQGQSIRFLLPEAVNQYLVEHPYGDKTEHMTVEEIRALVRQSLEDLKAQDIVELDVTDKTSVTDYLFIATGTSSRHVKSIANNVFQDAKNAGLQPLGMEGEADADWVLVDLGDVIVHVMQPQSREFYDLESLWRLDVLQRERQDAS